MHRYYYQPRRSTGKKERDQGLDQQADIMKARVRRGQIHAALHKLERLLLIKSEGCEGDRICRQYTYVFGAKL